jgi:hypothetical protein
MAFLDTLDENQPAGTKSAPELDDAERETRSSIKNTFDVEHHLTGEHQFFKGNTAARPPFGKANRIYLNDETGDIEVDTGSGWASIGYFKNRIKYLSYVGNGAGSQSITGLGFQPDIVFIIPITGTSSAFLRTPNFTTVNSYRLDTFTVITNGIISLDPDGFSVGSLANVNTQIYTAICLKVL